MLQIHLLGLGPAGQFLERVLEPPPKASVEGALAQLQALGALTAQQQLTPLGRLHLHYKEACICLKLCGRDVKGVTQRICQDLYCEAQRFVRVCWLPTATSLPSSTCRFVRVCWLPTATSLPSSICQLLHALLYFSVEHDTPNLHNIVQKHTVGSGRNAALVCCLA